jgi:hypothetical protein
MESEREFRTVPSGENDQKSNHNGMHHISEDINIVHVHCTLFSVMVDSSKIELTIQLEKEPIQTKG